MSTMWSTCSMSTGHCSTQAPQDVHDHSTSGSMTPPVARRSARPAGGPPRPARPRAARRALSSAASRYGALANAWSRRSMISSFGVSGLSVFQAGHCDWQRPHSVQVAKSSRPFQVKSSILPRPKTSSSSPGPRSRSAWSPEYIGSSGPSASGAGAKSTLNGARKMCRCLEYTTSTRNASTTPICSEQADRLEHVVGVPRPSGSSRSATHSDANAPCVVREVAGVDLRAAVEQQRPDDVEDHEQDEPGGAGVRAEEPGLAGPRLPGCCRSRMTANDDEADQHRDGEEVLDEPEPRPACR